MHPCRLLSETRRTKFALGHATVYPSTETLTNRGIQSHDQQMMQQLFLTQTLFTETLPDYLIAELKLIPKNGFVQFIFLKC
jgi:hypothetical protein